MSQHDEADEPCENINECLENPGICNYGTCSDTEDSYNCECHSGYGGPLCAERRESTSVFVTTGAILAIIVCAFVVLCEYDERGFSLTLISVAVNLELSLGMSSVENRKYFNAFK